MSALLLVAVVLPLGANLFVGVAGRLAGSSLTRRWTNWAGRAGAVAAGGSFVAATVLAVQVAGHGSVEVMLPGVGWAATGLSVDGLGVLLLLLVFGVSAVVQSFAGRYLAGDPRTAWFVGSTGLLTGASAGLMASATLLTLALCWTAAGLGLCLLLGTYRQLAAARDGVARAVRAFLVGDAALWVAVALASAAWGGIDLRHLHERPPAQLAQHPAVAVMVALLVVVAALSRSAQLPLHRWLPATLAAPTPVSALLHAGVVNAGGVLLVRVSPLVRPEPVAMGLAFTAGAVTAVYGTVVMLTKVDIKGALTHSTMGQMGFMIMTCGVGLYAAAVFHLVAHGLYKATLFLSSGSAISADRRRAAAPPPTPLSRSRAAAVTVTAVAAPAVALPLAVLVLPVQTGAGTAAASSVLLVFGWAGAVVAGLGWLRRNATGTALLAVTAATLIACFGYVALVHAVTSLLAPSLPVQGPVIGASWLILLVAALLGGASLLRRHPGSGRRKALLAGSYVLALTAGQVSAAAPRWSRRRRPARPTKPQVQLSGASS